MKATEILASEHRVIEQVLECLEKMADRCAALGTVDAESATQAIDFFHHFADHCHHGKEEQHLFPLLEARGFPRATGPTGVMLTEHEQGRRILCGLAEAVEGVAAGDAVAAERFVANAQAYINLLRDHIRKEDERLFVMADYALSREDQKRLLESFARVENEEMGQGTHEKYLQIANELADRWNVARADVEPACGHVCSCGHQARLLGIGD
jgi:hemerythrin-like domain-containing protein